MVKAIEVEERDGAVHRSLVAKVLQNTRDHNTLWVGVLYAAMIVTILAVVSMLR